MTPHPLATFAQISVSPQRRAIRQRRRRRAAYLLLRSVPGAEHEETNGPRIPVQRRPSAQ